MSRDSPCPGDPDGVGARPEPVDDSPNQASPKERNDV
jgi:hypothetical protein